ncbi:MAG TPA: substrate-binding domain-containing protein [Ktedonobacteraceae bacterium]|nr:substrate-binding domain-containing protein [Ktedonobacteraceae bacterium]
MAELAGVMVGNYFLLERLDSEGMVETYRARPTTQGGFDVILRLFRPQFPDPTGFQEHFAAEVEKVWRCHHEHIQPLLEFGAGEGLLYCVTRLIEAETLEQFLQRMEGQAASMSAVVGLMDQLCDALHYAHERGIVHGNLQPSSILLQDGGRLLLTNFSMKRIYQEGEPLMAQIEEGNAAYVAPEQVVGMITPASDIYAAGVLLFRLLTGRLPYEGESAGEIALKHTNEPIPSLRELRPDLSEAVELVVRVALAKTPQGRFPDATALAQALHAAVSSNNPPVIAVQPERRIFVRSRRTPFTWKRALTLLAIVLVLFGLSGTLLFFSALPLHLQDIPGLVFHNLGQSGVGSIKANSTAPPVSATSSPGGFPMPTSVTGGVPPVQSTVPPGKIAQTPSAGGTPVPDPGITPSPTPPPVCIGGTLAIDGPANLVPLLQQVNSDYTNVCPQLAVSLKTNTDRTSLNLLQNGQIDVATTDLTASSSWNVSDHAVAAILYTLIASPDVQISGLTVAQVQGIYAGKITNWAQVGGPDEAITVILRPTNDGITPIFRTFVLNGAPQRVKGMRLKPDSPGLAVQAVSATPGAISYVPLGAIQGANVQVLSINGIYPDAQTLENGSYSFWSVEHCYTSGSGSLQFQEYLQFFESGQEENVLSQFGAIPINLIDPNIVATHLPGPQI